MINDARRFPSGASIESDVCVVGAGPAGISIALQFIDTRYRVVLLETGDFDPAPQTQDLAKAVNVGLPYYALDACRPRCVGGTTTIWGGWCRPLDAIDFESQEWKPHSGWPFSRIALEPHYRKAHAVCRLASLDYDELTTKPQNACRPPRDSGYFEDTLFHIGPTRFGVAYRSDLRRATNISLLVNATVTELETNEHGSTIAGARAVTLARNSFTISARHYVLAAGGIENARILLLSRSVQKTGLGNGHDLVGRFFADHLHMPVGLLQGYCESMTFYQQRARNGIATRGVFALTEKVRRARRLFGYAATIHNADDPHDVLRPANHPGYQSAVSLLKAPLRPRSPRELFRHGSNIAWDFPDTCHMLYTHFRKPVARRMLLGCRAEQCPNSESRVMLDADKDAFGMQRARLQWKLTPRDLESLREAEQLLRAELSRQSIEVAPLSSFGEHGADIQSGAHHMGTTRMHSDPKLGVVDGNCRVHGVSNLHIAGGSVFPTTGWAPPTLTIVALSLRLAEKLKSDLVL